MNEYRITKYDPQLRDARGAYSLPNEWTSYSDVDRGIVSLQDYLATERSYVETAAAFLGEAGVAIIAARAVENRRGAKSAPAEGMLLRPSEWERSFRAVLREEWWCRFESEEAFVHFGWDYYMYVGVPRTPLRACAAASGRGLFVEPFTSPYHPEGEE